MKPAHLLPRLGEVCDFRSGVTLRSRPETLPADVLTIQVADLREDGSFDSSRALRMPLPTWSSRHVVSAGEVVFRSRGPVWAAWAAKDLGEPLVAIAPLFIMRPARDILDAGYLAWWLGRPVAQQHFAISAMGTGVKMITRSALEQTPIALPPVDEQRRIADAASLVVREHTLTLDLARLRADAISARLDLAATLSDREGLST